MSCGITGVVCSPNEVAMLKGDEETKHLLLIVPGTRSAGVDHGGQKNVQTPLATLLAGANDLVIGRQVTQARNPLHALELLEAEIEPAIGKVGEP